MPITLVDLFLDAKQQGAALSKAKFVLKTTQGQLPFVADGALEVNRQVVKSSSEGRVEFVGVTPSDDLLALGFSDGRWNLSSPDIPNLSVDFLVPRADDDDFSGGDLSILMALSVPEGQGSAPIGTIRGWTPQLANITDGARIVQRVVDWVGGLGDKPATGLYIGATGLVAGIGDAVNIRGAQGEAGEGGDGTSISNGGGGVSVDETGITKVTERVEVQGEGRSSIRLRDTAASDDNSHWDFIAQNHNYAAEGYDQDSHTLGLHFNETGAVLNMPQFSWNWEPRFPFQGTEGIGWLEHNWAYTSIDGTVSYRPLGFSIDLDNHRADWEYQGSLNIGHYLALNQNQRTMRVNPDPAGGGTVVVRDQFGVNRLPDGNTCVHFAGDPNGSSMMLLTPDVGRADLEVVAIAFPAITGNATSVIAQGAITGVLHDILRNYTGAALSVIWGANGDSMTRYLNSGADYTIGADRSAARFAVAQGDTLGTNDVLAADLGAGAGTTSLLLLDAGSGTMKRVNVGATDSGGAGQKLLTVAN